MLGHELAGIPAAVTAACDQVVAIPQYDMVPLLNMQTVAALAI